MSLQSKKPKQNKTKQPYTCTLFSHISFGVRTPKHMARNQEKKKKSNYFLQNNAVTLQDWGVGWLFLRKLTSFKFLNSPSQFRDTDLPGDKPSVQHCQQISPLQYHPISTKLNKQSELLHIFFTPKSQGDQVYVETRIKLTRKIPSGNFSQYT